MGCVGIQMPPPPPPLGQQPRPAAQPGQASQQPGAFSGRLPPLQQPGGFQTPQPRPVAADWARAYRDQQNKAAQVCCVLPAISHIDMDEQSPVSKPCTCSVVPEHPWHRVEMFVGVSTPPSFHVGDRCCLVQAAIARSAKWGTTEPSGRPSPSRQGSQGSGQMETLGSAGSGGLPSRPPLSGMADSPRPTKLDALLHAQQLAQQQQQQQQQQQSASSSHEGRPGSAGIVNRRALSGQLPATQSAAQFGVNPAQARTCSPHQKRRGLCPLSADILLTNAAMHLSLGMLLVQFINAGFWTILGAGRQGKETHCRSAVCR